MKNGKLEVSNVVEMLFEERGQFVDARNQLNDLSSKEWVQETKSFFFQKGLGAASAEARFERQHPAPFSFTDIIKLLRFFTKHGGKVLDPFVGVGSTLKACVETGREGYGVELSEEWCKLAKQRLLVESEYRIDTKHLICGDSRDVKKHFEREFFDFIITSPPYWNILDKKDHKAKQRIENGQATKYSASESDLGNLSDYEEFLTALSSIFLDCYDLLKPNKYMCVIVSDFRHKSEFYAFHADLMQRLSSKSLQNRFKLKGIKVLVQNAKKLFPYGYPFAYVENIHHQYVLVFQK